MTTVASSNSTEQSTLRTGQSAGQFAASLVTSIVIFSVQVVAFLLIKDRFARIYQPRTYLVPERERTKPVAPGWWKWIKPVLATSNAEFVQKCGLDAYFFLRYLRMLLKIFVPAALVILPILLPMNAVGGKGSQWALTHPGSANVSGLDQLSWSNVQPDQTNRYWAHWLLALALIVYVCHVSFDELKNYIRMRQAYMTSPQHRLRASATTVLVSSIPEKWLSVEALDGLYDVFPGGLRNIWINRNFDELNEKVKRRDDLARTLESAETDLIKKCFKKHEDDLKKKAKAEGKKISKQEKKRQEAVLNAKGQRQTVSGGMDSGDPHQVKHTVKEALGQDNQSDTSTTGTPTKSNDDERPVLPVPILGEGIHAIGQGLNQVGRGILDGWKGVNKGVSKKMDTTNGFVVEHDNSHHHRHIGHDGSTSDRYFRELEPVSEAEQSTGAIPAQREPSVNDATPRSAGGFSDRTPTAGISDNDREPIHNPRLASSSESDVHKISHEQGQVSSWQKIKALVGLGNCDNDEAVEYPEAFNEELEKDGKDAIWRTYIEEKDRDTMRLPIFGWTWMFSLPLIGEKVDTIYYCRKEVARLNVEIEDDQAHPERFPFMNSAFIQFNHQVAAHMACQSLSHHLPKQMAPRLVEIDPNDVIWDNMSIPWWQTYLRTGAVVTAVTAMVALWAIPVAFTSALAQLSVAAATYHWLHWILSLPNIIIEILQGVLAPALLALLMFLLPVILRYLSKIQGMQSGMLVELSVQKYYFFFLFVQIFLVVTVASSVVTFASWVKTLDGFVNIPNLLGTNIPKASNYFFSYMILQALSVSAGALVQVGGLVSWFILAPLFDNTARDKFTRQTQLSDVQWGTFFPVYTNLACIGLIYSVISPLILVFNIITFSLFWFVYRYQTLYITKFTLDTGGLLFPNAINLTFVGVYVMELALIGLFFLVRDSDDNIACTGQAIGMIVILVLTAGYQYLLNEAFAPLFRYLPITLEDDAVRRDEEFSRAMRVRHGEHSQLITDKAEREDIEDRLEAQERESLEQDHESQAYELQKIEAQRQDQAKKIIDEADFSNIELQNPEVTMSLDTESKGYRIMRETAQKAAGMTQKTADVTLHKLPTRLASIRRPRNSWAQRDNVQNKRSSYFGGANNQSSDARRSHDDPRLAETTQHTDVLDKINNFNPISGDAKDLEAQQAARDQLANALFSGISEELEDLSQDQRDALVQRAFQHSALRARRPVIWIPRDDLGVSDDEVLNMGKFSKSLWVSNVRQGLDAKGRCVYSGTPPDFSAVDVIRL